MAKRTIIIRFSVDKKGRPRAHYWGLAKRWRPISVAEAKIKLALREDHYGNEYVGQTR